jgi:hypothetical protein
MNTRGHAWHVPVRVADVPATGLHLTLVADESVRAAVAALAGLRDIARLEATVDISHHGDGLRAAGTVSAKVGQTCVITLDPVENEVEETFDVTFAPGGGPAPAAAGDGNDEPVAVTESPEALVDGVADIGAILTEFLLLGIDPYPKKPGAVFASPSEGDDDAGPFAALARLKH